MNLVHEELSGKIVGAAMQVLNTLKPGLDEKIYENALVLELEAEGHRIEQQRQFPVIYREVHVGTLIPDLIVNASVIVDAKVVYSFQRDTHGTDGRLPCRYESPFGAADKLQECQT